ncbi:MAG: hypothetical protein Q7W45_09975 [Bacteroidota bacterium]|nr:hypothetical protein [Bacteroidota bacterium]MDP3143799.1 hypothetical protein [Bacteroidota bacterium]MDP3556947.1 hypothetical protein [Bacteroidota bacterium]
MKTILVFITLLLFTTKNFAQLASVDANIKKLNNSQFKIIHGDKSTFEMNSKAAFKLIKIGKRASKKLLIALEDSSKNIMAHLVLCHIYFNVATFAGPKVSTVNDQHVSRYFLGQEKGEGLIISETKNNGEYNLYIEPEYLKATINFWKTKIK